MSSNGLLVKVTHGVFTHEVEVLGLETVGDLKRKMVEDTMVPADEQRLLFRGREILDLEILNETGVKNGSKLMLMENLQVREAKKLAKKSDVESLKAIKSIAAIHEDVDVHEGKVETLSKSLDAGESLNDKDFVILSELLMRELLKLDAIRGEGDVKQDRRAAVKRVQGLVDRVDHLRAKLAAKPEPAAAISGDETLPLPPADSPALSQSAAQQSPLPKPNLLPKELTKVDPSLAPDSIPPLKGEFSVSREQTAAWDPGMLFTNRSLPAQPSVGVENPFSDWEKFDSGLSSIPSPKKSFVPSAAAAVAAESAASPPQHASPPEEDPFRSPVARRKFSPRHSLSPSLSVDSKRSPSSLKPKKMTPPSQEASRKHVSFSDPKPPGSPSSVSSAVEKSPPSSATRTPVAIADKISTFSPTSLPQPTSATKSASRKFRFSPSSHSPSPSSSKDGRSAEASSLMPVDVISTFAESALPKPQVLAAKISRLAAEQRARSAATLEASRKSGKGEGSPSARAEASPAAKKESRASAKLRAREESRKERTQEKSGSSGGQGDLLVPMDLISLDPPPPAGSNGAVAAGVDQLRSNPFAVPVVGADVSRSSGQYSAVRPLNPFEEPEGAVDPSWEKF